VYAPSLPLSGRPMFRYASVIKFFHSNAWLKSSDNHFRLNVKCSRILHTVVELVSINFWFLIISISINYKSVKTLFFNLGLLEKEN
jgi:hypothetical protein